MEICTVLLILVPIILHVSYECEVKDVKTLIKGCSKLTGLNLITAGGTVINDHNCDVLLPKQVFAAEPTYKFKKADPKKFYTLLMIDLDTPPVDGAFYLHMMKSNVAGLALISAVETMAVGIEFRVYKPPTPSVGTGIHRYVVLLYEQIEGNNFLPDNVPSSRNRFNFVDWINGKKICGPVAGMQFRTQF